MISEVPFAMYLNSAIFWSNGDVPAPSTYNVDNGDDNRTLPLTSNLKVGLVRPIPTRLFGASTNKVFPLTVRLLLTFMVPETIWFPTNVFEPVVANTVEFNPSSKSALFA